MTLIQELMNQAAVGGLLQAQHISRFKPAEIRESIQQLVATEQIALAYALGDAGLSLYPNNEDMLAINCLLAVMRQEWSTAVEYLSALAELQGEQTQPFTYVMLVRALRCNLDPAGAVQAVKKGLRAYPGQLELIAEELALADYTDALNTSERTQ